MRLLFAITIVVFVVMGFLVPIIKQSKAPPVAGNTHNPTAWVASLQDDPRAGEKIYQAFCGTCHAASPAIHVGAPPKGDRKAWAPYQGQTVTQMVVAIDRAIGVMPPRGGCFECSDEQLAAAIRYMLPN